MKGSKIKIFKSFKTNKQMVPFNRLKLKQIKKK